MSCNCKVCGHLIASLSCYTSFVVLLELLKVFLVTFIFSFGVQTLFYIRYLAGDRKIIREHKVVFQYKSGIIGDALLIPATNVVAWLVLQGLSQWHTSFGFLLTSALGGLAITFVFHWGQQRFHLANWTMPTSGHWTLLGVYHAIFMCFEASFLCFVLFNYLGTLAANGKSAVSSSPIEYGLLILFLFFVTFVHDYWEPLFSGKSFGNDR